VALQVGQTYLLFADLLANLTYDNLALTLGALTSREPQVRVHAPARSLDASALTFRGERQCAQLGHVRREHGHGREE
jgi:hypothetical protein